MGHSTFVYTKLNSFKYCNLTFIVLFNFDNQSKRLNSSFWPVYETLTGITIPVSSHPENNGNKRTSPQSPNFKTEASPSDAV